MPAAFFWALAFWVLLESAIVLYEKTHPDFYGGIGLAWRYVKKAHLGALPQHPRIVILGDSTAGTLAHLLDQDGVLNLSMKIWDGMPAQYFLVREYLKSGGRPERIILITDFRYWDIEMDTPIDLQKATDTFFRPLGSFENAADLAFRGKRFDLAFQMIKESALPSRRFKVPLANALNRLGVFDFEMADKNPFEDVQEDMRQHLRWAEAVNRVPLEKNTVGYYFMRLKELCDAQGVKLAVFESPVYAERKQSDIRYEERTERIRRFLEAQGILYLRHHFIYPRGDFDPDGVHLVPEPARTAFAKEFLQEAVSLMPVPRETGK